MNERQFFENVLRRLGFEPTKNRLDFFMAWRKHEKKNFTDKALNNPLNTTWNYKNDKGMTKFNSHGVKNYSSMDIGLDATVKTLKLKYYVPIMSFLSQDIPWQGYKNPSMKKAMDTWGTIGFSKYFQDKKPKGNGGLITAILFIFFIGILIIN